MKIIVSALKMIELIYLPCLDDTGRTTTVIWVLTLPALVRVAPVGTSLQPGSPDTQALESLYLITFTYYGVS